MTRFIKQRDLFRCGPVAVLNSLKFFGKKVTYKDLPRISKICKSTRTGTSSFNLDTALRKLGKNYFSVRKLQGWSFDTIDEALRNNKLVVVNYDWEDRKIEGTVTIIRIQGHFTILVRDKFYNYYAVNNVRGKGVTPLRFDSFRSIQQRKNSIKAMWVLSKIK